MAGEAEVLTARAALCTRPSVVQQRLGGVGVTLR
jgi:hypothetical protein